MGCASSKLDDLPAVALCRERCSFLDEAIHYRYVLAESHLAYSHSLKAVGLSLLRFFDHHLDNSTAAPTSPLLNLPTHRKLDPGKHLSPPHSNSGSHLQFHSDSDDSVSESPLHHDHYSENTLPVNPYGQINYADYETLSSYSRGGEFMNMNYMKKNSTPSVMYQQPPVSSETVQIGESSSSSYSYYSNQNPNYGYGSGINGFFGSPPAPVGPVLANSEASTSKPPPPPPPSSSPWDFLYPFVSFDNYYPPYTPSRNSKEVRDEEGIPDLEDDHYHHHHQEEEVVVKEVHGHQKLVEGGGKNFAAENYDDGNVNDFYRTKQPSASVDTDPVEFEVHVVDKKVVEEERPNVANTAAFKAQDDSDVLREIQVQFDRASESGNEFAKLLEIGKVPHKKNYVSSMLNVIKPSVPVVSSQPSTSKNPELSSNIDKDDLAYLEIDEDVEARSGNLSSTLHKLYLWEKKLYEEVKVEEKMRVLHERKSHKLKRLDERGAEAHKVDATRTLVRSLSTKIRIAIQVVDKISMKINKLRDEVLWPQLNEFIQGLTGMWKAMLECHRSQCQALGQAKRLDTVTSREHFSDAHLEATLQLEHELISWTLRFSCWVGAQKGYVRALNNWLLKCLLYVPEETSDGIVPFSPGRIGAPTVFIICNQWSQALEKISEKEVVDSMRDFATSLLQLWEQDKQEMRQRMMANKDMERKVKILDREDQKLQKEIRALDKSIVLASGDGIVSGHVVYQSDTSKTGSLQVSLQRIFEAMERFTASSLRAHEELLQRIEEDRLARDNEKVS